MMCSRSCGQRLVSEDIVELIFHLSRIPEAEKLENVCVSALHPLDDRELVIFLPLLTHSLRFKKDACYSNLCQFLFTRAQTNICLANDFYWNLRALQQGSVGFLYEVLLIEFFRAPMRFPDGNRSKKFGPASFYAVENLIEVLQKISENLTDEAILQTDFTARLQNSSFFNGKNYFILPVLPNEHIVGIFPNDTKIGNSNTKPLTLTFNLEKPLPFSSVAPTTETISNRKQATATATKSSSSHSKKKLEETLPRPPMVIVNEPSDKSNSIKSVNAVKILFKIDDLRVDQVMMNVIRFMKLILQEEMNLGDYVLTYRVQPIIHKNKMCGFIEVAPESTTVYEIVKNGSLLNWMLDQKKNSNKSAPKVREIFVKSVAAYTVISYLLEVGDRHMHNFMVNSDGLFFHIDYGYVLGTNPTTAISSSHMRVTKQMIEAMGGAEAFKDNFKPLVENIYHCLRKRYAIIFLMLQQLATAEPPINNGRFTLDLIEREVLDRFAPDKSDKEAGAHFMNRLIPETEDENWGDIVHKLKVERVAAKAAASLLGYGYDAANGLVQYGYSAASVVFGSVAANPILSCQNEKVCDIESSEIEDGWLYASAISNPHTS